MPYSRPGSLFIVMRVCRAVVCQGRAHHEVHWLEVSRPRVRHVDGGMDGRQRGIATGLAAGQTLEQLEASVLLGRYKDWANFQLRAHNVEAAYRKLTTGEKKP